MKDQVPAQGALQGRYEHLPEDQYHANELFVGSSTLAQFRKSPLHFKTAWENPVEATDAMDRGTFIHRVVLEQDIACYVKRPVKEDGTLVRSNSKEYAAFVEANAGKRLISADLYDDAGDILSSVCNHRPFMNLLEASDAEVSYFGIHQATGQRIKARVDLLAKDRSFIVDVKSTARIETFERQVFDLGYDVRLMHYARTIHAVENLERMPDFYFLAIESAKPFGCKLFKLSERDQYAALDTWTMWMNELAACRQDDKWPGYPDTLHELRKPAWAVASAEPDFGTEE